MNDALSIVQAIANSRKVDKNKITDPFTKGYLAGERVTLTRITGELVALESSQYDKTETELLIEKANAGLLSTEFVKEYGGLDVEAK